MNTQAIREAIANRLQQRCGINAYPFDVASTVYPRAIVLPSSPAVEYHSSFGRGMCVLLFDIEVRTVATDPVSAQIALSKFVDAGTSESSSIIDALEFVSTGAMSPNLAGAVDNIMVESVQIAPGLQLTEGPVEFTATFRVQVLTRRT